MSTSAQPLVPRERRSRSAFSSLASRRCSTIAEQEDREDAESVYKPDEPTDLSYGWDPSPSTISTSKQPTDVVLHFPIASIRDEYELTTTGSLRATLCKATDDQASEISTRGLDTELYTAQTSIIDDPTNTVTGSTARIVNVVDELKDAIPPDTNAAHASDTQVNHSRRCSPSRGDQEGSHGDTLGGHGQNVFDDLPDASTRAACPARHGVDFTCRLCYRPNETSVVDANSEVPRKGTGSPSIDWSAYVVPATLAALALGGTALYLAYGGTSQADQEVCASVLDLSEDVSELDEATQLPSLVSKVQSWLSDRPAALGGYTWSRKIELLGDE